MYLSKYEYKTVYHSTLFHYPFSHRISSTLISLHPRSVLFLSIYVCLPIKPVFYAPFPSIFQHINFLLSFPNDRERQLTLGLETIPAKERMEGETDVESEPSPMMLFSLLYVTRSEVLISVIILLVTDAFSFSSKGIYRKGSYGS